ncbi:hypothetical protein IAD21_03269 [Abditibacteriota bacterium]|nr:hypothetical protein IAD21_03269 [Abditibacteriota bacterium]
MLMNFILRAAPLTAFLVFSASAARALPNPPEIVPAQGGPIKITPIFHASMQIEYGGKVIQVDPFSAGDYTGAKKADLILITHTHPDHLDLKAIEGIRKQSAFTAMIMPPAAATIVLHSISIRGANPVFPLNNGQSKTMAGIRVEAVPAYNIVRGPKPGQKFHPKGQFNGYILTLGGKRIYIAGDTEATPEMKALKKIDVAFLPMNLPFTMTPQEAAADAKAFKPKVVYPYHYRYPFDKANENPQQFQKALVGSGIQVRLRGWYAHPAPK